MPIPFTLRDLLILSAQKPSVDNCIISLMGILCNYIFFTAMLITRMYLCCFGALQYRQPERSSPSKCFA